MSTNISSGGSGGAASGCSAQAEPESAVGMRLSELEKHLNVLETTVTTLEDALAEVLCAPDPEADEEKCDVPVECATAARISSFGRTMVRHINRINTLINRLEV